LSPPVGYVEWSKKTRIIWIWYEFPMFMDPAEKYPVGSTEWSGRVGAGLSRIRACRILRLQASGRRAQEGGAGPPEEPWGTADRWARELIGLSWAKLMAIMRELDEGPARELEVGRGTGRGRARAGHPIGQTNS
jgi:hypothetical protein